MKICDICFKIHDGTMEICKPCSMSLGSETILKNPKNPDPAYDPVNLTFPPVVPWC